MIKNIVVTGGAGYIGSHTVVELVKSGFNPIIIDNFSNSDPSVINRLEKICNRKITVLNLDCTNEEKISNCIKWENVDGIIHFAAFKSVSESFKMKEMYFFNNIESTNNLLKIIKNYKIKCFVFSSSCTVYGEPKHLPVKETTKLKTPSSPYGQTKKICENLIVSSKIKNYTILRYFNPIGAHDSSLIGENPLDVPNNLVPLICECAIGKRKKIIIYGDDYSTLDGTCIRDYIHVSDLAEAHVLALKKMIKNSDLKKIYNIGLSKGISVLQLINLFEKSNNLKINYDFGKRRDGDIEKIFADCSLAKKELNWIPKKTIAQALIDAWNWEKNKKNYK